MSWETRYQPPDPALWQGRIDIPPESCFYQHVQLINLLKNKPEKTSRIAFALLGFKCDEGAQRDSGRTGAFDGPVAIYQRLANLPVQKPGISIYDVGNVICLDHDLEKTQQALADLVAILLKQNIRPIVVGGGHELAWGQYQGIAKVYKREKRLGILNFDSHFDLNPIRLTESGRATTTFFQIAEAHKTGKKHFDYNCIGIQHAGNIRELFDIAKQFNTKIILADDMHQGLQEKCFDFIDRIIDENDVIYMSLSMDVFSPAFAPGVAAIQPLGLSPWDIIPLIRQLAASAKVISYDIAEYVPRYDIDHRTAKLAATLIYEIVHHHNEHPRTW